LALRATSPQSQPEKGSFTRTNPPQIDSLGQRAAGFGANAQTANPETGAGWWLYRRTTVARRWLAENLRMGYE